LCTACWRMCVWQELDFLALETAARYEEPYGPAHPIIRQFWDIVHGFTEVLRFGAVSGCTVLTLVCTAGREEAVVVVLYREPPRAHSWTRCPATDHRTARTRQRAVRPCFLCDYAGACLRSSKLEFPMHQASYVAHVFQPSAITRVSQQGEAGNQAAARDCTVGRLWVDVTPSCVMTATWVCHVSAHFHTTSFARTECVGSHACSGSGVGEWWRGQAG
jgi:hypothetical protein